MLDVLYLTLYAGFSASTWAMLVLCERLMGGDQ